MQIPSDLDISATFMTIPVRVGESPAAVPPDRYFSGQYGKSVSMTSHALFFDWTRMSVVPPSCFSGPKA